MSRRRTGRKVTPHQFSFKEKIKSLSHHVDTEQQKIFSKLTDAQINMFGNQLSRLHEVSHLAEGSEVMKHLASKIKEMLRDPIQQKTTYCTLKELRL